MHSEVIKKAKVFCIQNKARLTHSRLEVLKIIAASSKPIGAYAILEQLGKILNQPKPPTVYRAIDFWVQSGFIHSINGLNAYMICCAEHQHKVSQFMICDNCNCAIETHPYDLPHIISSCAKQAHFVPTEWALEIHGLCSHCQS
jgi:Fur family zinc uptake transcriptional regulator